MISCSKRYKENIIRFESKKGIITLESEDFQIIEIIKGKHIRVKVNNDIKLDSIKELIDCKLIIFLKEKYIANGIHIKSSIKPKDSDYFFSEDKHQRIIIFKDKSLRFLSIDI